MDSSDQRTTTITTTSQKKDLLRILEHPANESITFTKEEGCFRLPGSGGVDGGTGKVIRGLLPVLKRCFWPNYEYQKRHNSYYSAATTTTTTKSTGVRSRRQGLARGDLVHNQLEMFTNRGIKALRDRYDGVLHPFTEKVIDYLEIQGMTPMISELPVYDEGLGIATKADSIALDGDGRLTVIEWKCGMDNYIHRGCTEMSGPLRGRFSDSPLNQALVQLMFTIRMIERTFGVKVSRSYVVQIENDAVSPYQIPESMWELAGDCIYEIGASDDELLRKKKKRKIKGIPGMGRGSMMSKSVKIINRHQI